MYECIEYQKKNKVAIIAIDQVQDNNRVNRETLSEMIDALHDAQADSGIAAIIITGKGDFFCTGGRMNGFPDGLTMDVKGFADAFSNLQLEIYKCSKPVIAAVNGNAVAGGFCIMESCDIAIVGKDCKFGLPELSRGNFPMLALAIVMKALPKKLVFELAYSSQLVDAETVKEWHLVNRVVDQDKVLDTAIEFAEMLASYNGVAASLGREAYYNMVNMNLEQAVLYGKGQLITLLTTEDVKEAATDADVIYTDVWVSMGEPVEVWAERINDLAAYQINQELMKIAGPKAVFMHCLPAYHDHKTTVGKEMGERFGRDAMEVTDQVFEGPKSIVFDEAENRMHTIKAVMAATLGYEA